MTWYQQVINGAISVSQNKPRLNANSLFIDTTMKVSHFWNQDAHKDGHHIFVQSPAFTSGGSPADPALATDMDGIFYNRQVTKQDASTENYGFFRNSAGISLLGIRAAVNFEGTIIRWGYNVSSVTSPTEGVYIINFINPLPTNNYVVSGCAYLIGNTVHMSIESDATYNNRATVSSVRVRFEDHTGNAKNINRGMVQVIGG